MRSQNRDRCASEPGWGVVYSRKERNQLGVDSNCSRIDTAEGLIKTNCASTCRITSGQWGVSAGPCVSSCFSRVYGVFFSSVTRMFGV